MVESNSEPGTPLTIFVDNPIALGVKGTFSEVYKYIMTPTLGRETLQRVIIAARDELYRRAADGLTKLSPNRRQEIMRSDEEQTQWRIQHFRDLVGDSPLTYSLFLKLVEGDDRAWGWLVGGNGRIKEVAGESVQPLTSHIICAKMLAMLFRLATLTGEDDKPLLFDSVFLLVDQTEDLIQLGPGPYQEQIGGWRTLIDENSISLPLTSTPTVDK